MALKRTNTTRRTGTKTVPRLAPKAAAINPSRKDPTALARFGATGSNVKLPRHALEVARREGLRVEEDTTRAGGSPLRDREVKPLKRLVNPERKNPVAIANTGRSGKRPPRNVKVSRHNANVARREGHVQYETGAIGPSKRPNDSLDEVANKRRRRRGSGYLPTA